MLYYLSIWNIRILIFTVRIFYVNTVSFTYINVIYMQVRIYIHLMIFIMLESRANPV